jgi:hypothetical protein
MLFFFVPAHAVVEWNVEKTFKLEKPPVDVAVSGKGQWVFVLAEGGKLFIYSQDGVLKDSLTVGSEVDGVAAGPREDLVFLSSRKGATVQTIVLDFVYDIDTAGGPLQGPPNAPVTIVIFNDFQ